MDIDRLKELEIYAKKCVNCGCSSLDSCYSCINHRVGDGDIFDIIQELVKLKEIEY